MSVFTKAKKIGIIGGMGPEATAVLYRKIIKQFQALGAKYDSDYPEMVIWNLPIPDVVESSCSSKVAEQMLCRTTKLMESLGMDFIAIPCNTAQIFFKSIKASVKIPVLNIVEQTSKEVETCGCKKVGVMATGNTIKNQLYGKWLDGFGIEQILPTEGQQKEITPIILNILSGKRLKTDKEKLIGIAETMINEGAEGIILGCTELPLLISESENIKFFDSLRILANVAVENSTNGFMGVNL